MSFNKRFFDWNRIKDFAGRSKDFISFDNWMLGPDAHFLKDVESSDFLKIYSSQNNEDRTLMFNAFGEDNDFIVDLVKLLRVTNNKNNEESHIDTVEKYKFLFSEKWGIKYDQYKNLIQ